MSLQIRRGTQAQLSNITPVVGEMIYTTDSKQVFVGDGSTAGGIAIAVGSGGTVTANLIGNVTGSLSGVLVSVSGNVLSGNILASGFASVAGNVTASYLIGNGSQLTGITSAGSRISNGNTEINIGASAGNANISVNGTSNVAVFANTGVLVNGTVSASGNITGGNISVTGINGTLLTASQPNITTLANLTSLGTANVTTNALGNIAVAGIISSTGNIISSANIIGGNLSTAGQVSASANVTGGNLITNGLISATANIYSNATVHATNDIYAGGNITATAYTGTLISVVGNVTGNYFFGNGACLTGIITSVSNINNGTSNVNIPSSGGNILISVGGNYNVATVTNTGILVNGLISVSGNVTGAYIIGNGSQLTGLPASYGNANVSNYLANFGSNAISTSGNITGGNLSVGTGKITTNNIVNGGSNATGNIGSSSTYFNTVFAQATTALYADLAECYLGDAYYAPGTVVSFGGPAEITFCDLDQDTAVAGVISTNPAYEMNSGLTGDYVTTVALVGRVPCKVIGPVNKGALMVSAGNGMARAESSPRIGTVIGKAVESFDGSTGLIEIVVGRV